MIITNTQSPEIDGCAQTERGRIAKTFFSFVCPKKWDQLKETDDPSVRHCGWCKESVTMFETHQEAQAAGPGLHCVAIAEVRIMGSRRRRPEPKQAGD
jgi:hypothetical protein